MILYAILMFVTAVIFGLVAVLIYKGKTNLIHDYHQAKVTDKAGYGKAFGKALSVIGFAILASGIAGLFQSLEMVALTLLMAGLVVGIGYIIAVQKKYNNGIF